MPRGNRTGPDGAGPMTGRGVGYCNGYDSPGFTRGSGRGMGGGFSRGFGRGFRRFAGFGNGVRNFFGRNRVYNDYEDNYAQNPINPEDEKQMLKDELDIIQKRLEYLEKNNSKEKK